MSLSWGTGKQPPQRCSCKIFDLEDLVQKPFQVVVRYGTRNNILGLGNYK